MTDPELKKPTDDLSEYLRAKEPGSPRSPTQRYRLTPKGIAAKGAA